MAAAEYNLLDLAMPLEKADFGGVLIMVTVLSARKEERKPLTEAEREHLIAFLEANIALDDEGDSALLRPLLSRLCDGTI